MTQEIKLTNDHLKLIPFLFIQEKGDDELVISRKQLFSLGSHLLEDIAFILGRIDEAIPNTQNDAEGRAFKDDFEKYMLDLYNYLSENLLLIESLVHSYATRGGLTEGVYSCDDADMIWKKIN